MTDEFQFYPTPEALVEQMVAPYVVGEYEWTRRIPGIILDPSAGMGDILAFIKKKYRNGPSYEAKATMLGIEPQMKGRLVLAGLGVTLLAYDFFRYPAADRHIDFIIMNPPFRNGAKHLMHAWSIAPAGCRIVCVLNRKTLDSLHTNEREVLAAIIEANGSVEDVGQPFLKAERPTDVRCVIVRLTKPAAKRVVDFESLNLEEDPEVSRIPDPQQFMGDALARRGETIQSLVQSYEAVRELIAQRDAITARVDSILNGIKVHPSQNVSTDAELKAAYWGWVWKATTIGERTTSQFREGFDALQAASGSIAFSVENVVDVLQSFVASAPDIMKACIEGAFDEMTLYHRHNRDASAAWATNESYRIAQKIVLPWHNLYSDGYWHNWDFKEEAKVADLDKAVCFVMGVPYAEIIRTDVVIHDHIESLLGRNSTVEYDKVLHSTWFEIRIFKKGTVHLKWKDLDAWAKFNIAAAKYKNWIPDVAYDAPEGSARARSAKAAKRKKAA